MKKNVLSLVSALMVFGALSAQNILITYNAAGGVSTLGGGAATEVYLHSGGGVAAPFEATVGNWGMDDGVGEMTETADDVWELAMIADEYYAEAGYVGGNPVNFIGMVFRNGDGTLQGKGDADTDIFATYNATTLSYDVTECACVTVTNIVEPAIETITAIDNMQVGPNPFATSVQFSYDLVNANNVTLSVYNMLGAEVATIVNGTQASGTHTAVWAVDANLANGNYIYRLQVGNEATSGNLIKQ